MSSSMAEGLTSIDIPLCRSTAGPVRIRSQCSWASSPQIGGTLSKKTVLLDVGMPLCSLTWLLSRSLRAPSPGS